MEEREAMMRQETIAMKRIDKSKELARMSKMQEFQKEQTLQLIKEKDMKAQEFK
jgi:hypothetical protein